ncbi:hypothetical protein JHL21_13210 [Devosia sp. WQ 349]|uniref:hypothetical protein n=1 Tax=Devosia sp. WQ 349K1 TaxID=2800329 RepID=UPI001905A728|nr:hypothetical protein [Devosia sp. WQ 349K1]MBK1795456.1 hypothetical protein [Devosia sp. WQ 349K1]
MKIWKIRKLLNASGWFCVVFLSGTLLGIVLVAFLPGMPWLTNINVANHASIDLAQLDLQAQMSMAGAAWWMVAITSVATVAGTMSLYLIYRTLLEAQRSATAAVDSNRIQREFSLAELRAYLSVSRVTIRADIDGSFLIEFFYENSGSTPATNIATQLTIAISGYAADGSLIEITSIAAPENRSDLPATGKAHGKHLTSVDAIAEGVAFELPQRTTILCHLIITYKDIFGNNHPTKDSLSNVSYCARISFDDASYEHAISMFKIH